MAASRHLELGETGNSAIRSAVPEKPYPRIKHEVDRMIRCRDMAVRNFTKCKVGRSAGRSVGRSLVLNITLFSYTPLRYVRNVAREE